MREALELQAKCPISNNCENNQDRLHRQIWGRFLLGSLVGRIAGSGFAPQWGSQSVVIF